MVESVTLALVGGMAGILIGARVAWLISVFSPLRASVEISSVVVALVVSSSVGIFFGIFPAMKAARLNPIEALRYE